MNLQELKNELINICKELKKDISKWNRHKLKKRYNQIMNTIILNYKGYEYLALGR